MIMLDSNIVAVSLPSIARDLNATFADIEWVVSAYVLTFAALLMPSGALADRYGRRRMLTVGLAIFTWPRCSAASPRPRHFSTRRARCRAWARRSSLARLSRCSGTHSRARNEPRRSDSGERSSASPSPWDRSSAGSSPRLWAGAGRFLVNIPFGAALIWLAIDAVEESRDPDAQRLDVVGMLSLGFGLFCLIWALIGANRVGWSAEQTLAKLLASAVLFALFVAAELIQERPMVDFALFRKRTFLGASFAMLGFAAAAQVMMTYLPLYLQNVFALSPAAAGLGMLPFALPLFFCPRIAASLSNRISGRDLLALGLAIVALGNLATAAMVAAYLLMGSSRSAC